MKSKTVGDFMLPLADHATVSEEAPLQEAALAFEQACARNDCQTGNMILVLNKAGQPIGELSELEVLRSLEPGYKAIGDLRSTSLSGLNTEFLTNMLQHSNLWQDPLGALCEKAATTRVGDVDYQPLADQSVTVDTPLTQAIHFLIVCQRECLLVKDTKAGAYVGILHRRAVFQEVLQRIQACGI